MRTSMSRTASSISSSTTSARTGLDARPVDLTQLIHDALLMQTDQGLEVELLLPEEAVRMACHPISIPPYPQQSVGQLPALWGDPVCRPSSGMMVTGCACACPMNGPGFAEAGLLLVLKPFTQGNVARTGGGSGLGLAIVAKIVSQHHGTIRLGRSGTRGLLVEIRLPQNQPQEWMD